MVSLPVVWQSADIIMALMAMTNLTAILLLSPTVRIIASDYLRQRRLGIQPTFDATRYPDIDQQLAPGARNCRANSAIDPTMHFLLNSSKLPARTGYADSDFTC